MCKVYNKYKNPPTKAVYVGRGSQFGNPYRLGVHGNRDEVCDKFSEMVENDKNFQKLIVEKLKGRDLVCFCKPLRCHADTLLRVANKKS